MARVATAFKRLFLRNLIWSATDSGGTLADTLKSAAQAQLVVTSTGLVLTGTNANGHSYTWEVPRDFSPQDSAELISNLLDRYDEAVAEGFTTDATIGGEMLRCLQPVRGFVNDFTYGRIEREDADA